MGFMCPCAQLVLTKMRKSFHPVILRLHSRSAGTLVFYSQHSRSAATLACYSQHRYTPCPCSSVKCRNVLSDRKMRVFSRCLSDSGDADTVTCHDDNINEHVLEKIEALAEDIKGKVRFSELSVMTKDEIIVYVKTFLEHGLPVAAMDSLAEHPGFLHDPQRLVDLLKALKNLALSKRDMATMITNYPTVLTFTKSAVMEAFYKLLNVGFTSDLIVKMFVQQPQIILYNFDSVARRIEELKLLFNTKHTFSLLTSNPGLLFNDLEEIRKTFMYVYNEMGVTQPQMMHSKMFSYPLEHIHTRHMFLVRAGFMRRVKEKERFQNPKLDIILDTSDAVFAKKFGNMTVQEYNCFKALLLREELLYVADDHGKIEDHDDENDSDAENDEEKDSSDLEAEF